jgi:hypothetical protein
MRLVRRETQPKESLLRIPMRLVKKELKNLMNMPFGVGPVDQKNVLKRAFDKEQFCFSGISEIPLFRDNPNERELLLNSIHKQMKPSCDYS